MTIPFLIANIHTILGIVKYNIAFSKGGKYEKHYIYDTVSSAGMTNNGFFHYTCGLKSTTLASEAGRDISGCSLFFLDIYHKLCLGLLLMVELGRIK
jgi:hypothetical protein